jgi:hypothetical protein
MSAEPFSDKDGWICPTNQPWELAQSTRPYPVEISLNGQILRSLSLKSLHWTLPTPIMKVIDAHDPVNHHFGKNGPIAHPSKLPLLPLLV